MARNSVWGICSACGKRGWDSRRSAKAALKEYFPGEIPDMKVYRCGNLFHHGHRVPARFRGQDNECRNCHRLLKFLSGVWVHADDELEACNVRGLEGELSAQPFWKSIED